LFSLLIQGYPIGAAMEEMNSRYAQFSTELTNSLQPVLTHGMDYDDDLKYEVARLWTANNDARNYIIVGDPAVRLPVSKTEMAPAGHPVLPPFEPNVASGAAPSETEDPAQAAARQDPGPGDDEDEATADSFWTPGRPPKALLDDPELLQYWRAHIKSGYEHNDEMFRRILEAFLGPYHTTVRMNIIIFAVGILSFVGAIILSVWYNEPLYALAFGGLTTVSFLGYFISRPLRSLEENLEFITWLGMIYNTYWTRVVSANNPAKAQEELQSATDDAIAHLERLIDKHAALSRRRPKPGK
jgi:hypothetical protein